MAKKLKTSTKGYKKNSPDKGEDSLYIPSNHITMKGVPHPVMAIDSQGNHFMMMPGEDYYFPGSQGITEIPVRQKGGQQIPVDNYPSTSTAKFTFTDATPSQQTTKKVAVNQTKKVNADKLNADRKKDDEEAKKFLKTYYEYAAENVPFYSNLSHEDSSQVRRDREAAFEQQIKRLEAQPAEIAYGSKLDSLVYYQGYPEFIKNPSIKKALLSELEQGYKDFRKRSLNDVMAPDSVEFVPEPKLTEEGVLYGQYNPKTNITWVSDKTRLNTLVHERAHKADESKYWKGLENESQLRKDLMASNLTPEAYQELNLQGIEYLLDFSERQARHRTTQHWLSQNFPGGYDPTKPITDKEYDFLQKNIDKIPFDVKQLFSSYGGRKDLYLKYINSFRKGGTTFQDGGQLIKKYGQYVDKRQDWIKKVGQNVDYSGTNQPFYQFATDIAKKFKIDPALFIASAYEEGVAANFYPDKKGTVYFTGNDDFPVAGFEGLGLDRFSERFDEFVKKGYLDKDFKNRFTVYETENEKGRKIKSADFKTIEDALTAKAAFVAAERDQLNKYVKQKKYSLTPEAQQFFELAAYNAGQTGAQEMLQYFVDNKLLDNNSFLTNKPQKYQGVYDNVMRRIQGANMLKGETDVLKKGGGIHIKPENKGKFTDYCGGKVTQECIERGKNSPNPTIRKRATFAANARKWNHEEGGEICFECGGKVKKAQDGINLTQPRPGMQNLVQQNNQFQLPGLDNTPSMTAVKKKNPFNWLPVLNSINFAGTKISEVLRNNELADYQRQMEILQNQQVSYIPEGQFQYGDPDAYQSGGIIPQDISYMAMGFDMPTFGGYEMPVNKVAPPPIPVPEINKRGKIQEGVFKGVEQDVAQASEEILNMFPKLKVTSTVRNWGDKDAHPKGRAVDISGDFKTLAEAWKHYKDKIVTKYGFNEALPLDHGTGPHIHVGYYRKGGVYELSDEQISALEAQGYKYETI